MTNRKLHDSDQPDQPERSIRAAEYVRMSTDHQKYSTENQSDAIKQYADSRGIEIVRTYADAGKSGLKIEGRDALRQLIEDVQTGNTDFTLGSPVEPPDLRAAVATTDPTRADPASKSKVHLLYIAVS